MGCRDGRNFDQFSVCGRSSHRPVCGSTESVRFFLSSGCRSLLCQHLSAARFRYHRGLPRSVRLARRSPAGGSAAVMHCHSTTLGGRSWRTPARNPGASFATLSPAPATQHLFLAGTKHQASARFADGWRSLQSLKALQSLQIIKLLQDASFIWSKYR